MANITKRGDSYLIRVSCGYDANDKKIIRSMTWKPDPKLTTKQIEKELNRQAMLFEEKCRHGLVSNDPRLTFADFVPQYLTIKKDVLSPHTYEDYKNTLERYIIPQLGHLKLAAIRPVHIQEFVKYLSEGESIRKHKNGEVRKSGKTHSPATVRRYLAMVQSVLNQAVKLELIPNNPAKAEKLTLPKITTTKVEIFTKQEAAEMLAYLENEPLQYRALIQVAIMTGARRGELVALKFSDIDRSSCRITIERAAVKVKGEPLRTKPPKDFEVRSVTVPQYCIDLLDDLKEEKRREAARLGDAWHYDDYIFTQYDGSMMNPDTVTKWFSGFLSKNGLKHRKFHSLRHTSATLLLYGGASIKQVQGRLGHGDIETTNKYLHYIAEADSESANILQNMLITHKSIEEHDDERRQA